MCIRDRSHLDLLTDHRNSHTQSWTTHFIANINHHSDYLRIQPSLHNKPWFVDFPSFLRRAIVPICQLRFGHHCLPATLARFMPNVLPYCPLHPTTFTLTTLNHIFFVYPELQANIKNFKHILSLTGALRPWSVASLLAPRDLLIYSAYLHNF